MTKEKNYRDLLTVLIPLKGRPLYTLRWMDYANRTHFPFKVLFADGSYDADKRIVEEELSNKENYPNVDYDYVIYPYDQSLQLYFSKVYDSLKKIKTPFTCFTENDTFLFPDSVKQSVDFLLENSDYSSSRGQHYSFNVSSKGKQNNYKINLVKRIQKSIVDSSALERLEEILCNEWRVVYNDVRRTSNTLKYWSFLTKLNLSDQFLAGYLTMLMTVIDGKINRDNRTFMIREKCFGQTQIADEDDKIKNRIKRMLFPTWSRDYRNLLETLAHYVFQKDDIDFEIARVEIDEMLCIMFKRQLTQKIYTSQNYFLKFNGFVKIHSKLKSIIKRIPYANPKNIFKLLFRRETLPANYSQELKDASLFLETNKFNKNIYN